MTRSPGGEAGQRPRRCGLLHDGRLLHGLGRVAAGKWSISCVPSSRERKASRPFLRASGSGGFAKFSAGTCTSFAATTRAWIAAHGRSLVRFLKGPRRARWARESVSTGRSAKVLDATSHDRLSATRILTGGGFPLASIHGRSVDRELTHQPCERCMAVSGGSLPVEGGGSSNPTTIRRTPRRRHGIRPSGRPFACGEFVEPCFHGLERVSADMPSPEDDEGQRRPT